MAKELDLILTDELNEVVVEEQNEITSLKLSQLLVYNDDFNTFDWVIQCFMEVCNHSFEQSEQLSLIVHYKGKAIVKTGDFDLLTKKERSKIDKEVTKLERNLGGIKDMRKLPGAIFIVDPNNERIAVKEANCLGIPVVAVADTNCNPDGVDYVVPGNDDAIKSITLFAEYFANSVNEGNAASIKKGKKSKEELDRDVSLEKEILSKFEKDIDLKED